jgi:hypothetical protein
MAIETKPVHPMARHGERVREENIGRRWEDCQPRLVVYVGESREERGETRFVPAASTAFRGRHGRRPDPLLRGDLLRRRSRMDDAAGERRW